MHYSSSLCRRMTSSSSIPSRLPLPPCYARLYSNASAPLFLLRSNPNASPLPLNALSRPLHRSSQYPISLPDRSSRQWRFMSVKPSAKATSSGTSTIKDHGFKYETNDVTTIERLTSPTVHIQQHIQQSVNSASESSPETTAIATPLPPRFDTTALKTYVQNGQLEDALALVLRSESTRKGILDYPSKDRHLFFTSLGCLSSLELVSLLEPWMQQQQQQQMDDTMYNKRLKQFLKSLGSHLPLNLMEHLVQQYPLDVYLQTALFQRFVKSYMACQLQSDDDDRGAIQLDALLDYLDPSSNIIMEKTSDLIRTRLYNMALNGCLKLGHWDHVDKVLSRMESSGSDSGCLLDVASFNMLIRSRLDNGDVNAANALYEQLTNPSSTSLGATTATFNTFINYACQQHLWDEMTLWLDRLLDQQHHSDLQPNPVTLRILTAALTEHIEEPLVVNAFERVAKMVPVTSFELESTVNTSIVHLLRHKHTDVALALLYRLFDQSSTGMAASSYHLSVNSYNILIHALAQKGDMDTADQLIESMRDQNDDNAPLPLPDIVSYTTLIHGYVRSASATHMDLGRISALYKEVMERGLETNPILQSVVLYAMVKSGFEDIKECTKLFESMVDDDHGDMAANMALRKNSNSGNTSPSLHFDNDDDMNDSRQRGMDPKMSRMTIRNRHIPPESLTLLNRAIEKGLPLTTATLNIWVRGLALFNHDLQTAESMVKWMSLAHGVELNERTIYYLVRAALAQDRRDKARKWISLYEDDMNRTIQGTGLLYFKNMVIKS
ncbi:hypothetical protein BCR42DRAFT_396857 [Absidia repens]|uniref:Pentacotripeptide-repeat region of PRORP domain-containing protein n=1 Tax=Absidia repens TaxID=90262 RepID=A0A1X2I2I9_9FUNG|nr:hypothetical protein BCR42DRAFT_396857 [Absidia repens]